MNGEMRAAVRAAPHSHAALRAGQQGPMAAERARHARPSLSPWRRQHDPTPRTGPGPGPWPLRPHREPPQRLSRSSPRSLLSPSGDTGPHPHTPPRTSPRARLLRAFNWASLLAPQPAPSLPLAAERESAASGWLSACQSYERPIESGAPA